MKTEDLLEPRYFAIVGLVAIVALALVWDDLWEHTRKLPPVASYIFLDVDGPPDWVAAHRLALEWQGTSYPLPAVFSLEDQPRQEFGLGTAGDWPTEATIGGVPAPITITPEAPFTILAFRTDLLLDSEEIASVSRWVLGPEEHVDGRASEGLGEPSINDEAIRQRLRGAKIIRLPAPQ